MKELMYLYKVFNQSSIHLSIYIYIYLFIYVSTYVYSIFIYLHTCIMCNNYIIYHFLVIKPKITTKCSNITTEVGLPVTLTCFVEGDPNHYYVGWLTRNTVIHKGEDHSISTTPNFRSPNSTIHYLTIHSIKRPGKYECRVYSMTGDVQDQVSHQVFVNKGMYLIIIN